MNITVTGTQTLTAPVQVDAREVVDAITIIPKGHWIEQDEEACIQYAPAEGIGNKIEIARVSVHTYNAFEAQKTLVEYLRVNS